MSYTVVEDFRLGLDRRRKRIAAPIGSLWNIVNAHITRGGEIERAKKFVSTYALPAGQTFGYTILRNAHYVFGSGPTPTMPSGVNYQRLQHPDGTTAMSRIRDVQPMDGKLYVVAEFTDGNLFHFYDGAIVKDWYAGRVASWMADLDGVAAHMADLFSGDTQYSAVAAGSVVTITGQNNEAFTIAVNHTNGGSYNDESIVAATTQAAGASQPQISTVTLGGTFDPGDTFTIKITDDSSGVKSFGADANPGDPEVGHVLLTFKSKMHAASGSLVTFSGVNTPAAWNRDATLVIGEGFINASTQDEGAQDVTALSIYQGQLAIFAEQSIQIWQIGVDPLNNAYLSSLQGTGTSARRSVLPYGNNDSFYLDFSGIRSLRARDSSNAAFVSDVGTSIDTHVRAWVESVGDTVADAAVAAIEPEDGRYLLAIGTRIYVFSFFPGSKINAWSYYEPGFTVTDFARTRHHLYARAGDTIYLYGGAEGDSYPDDDEQVVTIELPFIGKQKPASEANWDTLSVALTNEWRVKILPDPNDETAEIDAGTFSNVTFHLPRAELGTVTTHVAAKLTCSKAGAATISALIFNFQEPRETRR